MFAACGLRHALDAALVALVVPRTVVAGVLISVASNLMAAAMRRSLLPHPSQRRSARRKVDVNAPSRSRR